jgi:hypothetical protein
MSFRLWVLKKVESDFSVLFDFSAMRNEISMSYLSWIWKLKTHRDWRN